MIGWLYRFCNRNWWQLHAITIAIILVLMLILLTGCGTSRDSQTKTVERLTTSTGPVLIDTPIGQFAVAPIRHEMVRSETEVSTEQTRIDAPEVGAIMTAAAGGTPFGAIAGIVGALGAAGAGFKALQIKRQRDELVDGIERGSKEMSDEEWQKMRAGLEAEQSADTKRAVKARVG
jgi:hypothetical protein